MAGMGTRDIKRKIKSVNNTRQITKAMELVSTAKLKKAKDKMNLTKPYFHTVLEAVNGIVEGETGIKHIYMTERNLHPSLYIVITGDRGLCGGYNINIIKEAVKDAEGKNVSFLVIGRKGASFLRTNGYDIQKAIEGISEKPTFNDALQISRIVLDMYNTEKIDEIKLFYTNFVSTISQVPECIKLLPLTRDEKDIVEEMNDELDMKDFISYEPSPEVVLDFIIPKYISGTIYGGLIESAAAEQAARRIAMENASNNADDMIEDLTLSFNQARQAAITQEIAEIVGGAEALK